MIDGLEDAHDGAFRILIDDDFQSMPGVDQQIYVAGRQRFGGEHHAGESLVSEHGIRTDYADMPHESDVFEPSQQSGDDGRDAAQADRPGQRGLNIDALGQAVKSVPRRFASLREGAVNGFGLRRTRSEALFHSADLALEIALPADFAPEHGAGEFVRPISIGRMPSFIHLAKIDQMTNLNIA